MPLPDLHIAVKENDIHTIETLANNQNFDINQLDSSGKTALHLAARLARTQILQTLIKFGANLDIVDKIGQTTLHNAIYSGDIEVIKIIIQNRPQIINLGDKNKKTAIHIAAMLGETDIIKCLVDLGAHVHLTDNDEQIPAYYTIVNDDSESIKYLINSKTSTDRLNTKLFQSNDAIKEEVIKAMFKAQTLSNKLQSLYKRNEIDRIKSLMKYEIKLDSILIKPYEEALCKASKIGNIEDINTLIGLGIDVNDSEYLYYTPIRLAVQNSKIEAVKILIANQANLNEEYNHCRIPLIHLAVQKKELEMLKLLIEGKANVNQLSGGKKNPIHTAIEYDNIDSLEILAKAGSDVNALNSINETPLMLAVKKANNHKILTELVRLGANTEIRDERKNTSLLLAARQGKAEAVKSLINSKANIKATNTDGESIIHEATKSDDINTLKTAIELWPSKDIDLINHNKRTPLQIAARRTAVNSFKTLIEAGADYSKTIKVQKYNYNSYLSPFKFLSEQKILNNELLEWVVSKNISLASFYEYDVVKCFSFLHKSPGGVFDGLTQFIMSDSTLDSLTNTLIKEPRIYQVSIHAHNFAKDDFIEKALFLFTVNRVCKKIRGEKEFSSDQHIYEIYSAISQNLLTDLSSKKCISLNEIIKSRFTDQVKQSEIYRETKNLIINKFLDKSEISASEITHDQLSEFSLSQSEFEEFLDNRPKYLLQTSQYNKLIKYIILRQSIHLKEITQEEGYFKDNPQDRAISIAITPIISDIEQNGMTQSLGKFINHITQISKKNPNRHFARNLLKPILNKYHQQLEDNLREEVSSTITDLIDALVNEKNLNKNSTSHPSSSPNPETSVTQNLQSQSSESIAPQL